MLGQLRPRAGAAPWRQSASGHVPATNPESRRTGKPHGTIPPVAAGTLHAGCIRVDRDDPVAVSGQPAVYTPRMGGVWNIRTSEQLLAKLEHDLERMQAAPTDARPAFDFFVTAFHLADWVHDGDEDAARAMVKGERLLTIAGHIANKTKHFELREGNWTQVEGTPIPARTRPGLNGLSMSNRSGLVIRLDQDYSLKMGRRDLPALVLAAQLLKFWRDEISKRTRPPHP